MTRDAETIRALLGTWVHRLDGSAPLRPIEAVALVATERLSDAARAWVEEALSPAPHVASAQPDDWLTFGPVRALAVQAVLDELVAPALRVRRSERAFVFAATLGHRTTSLRDALDALLDAPDPVDDDDTTDPAVGIALGDPVPDRATSIDQALVLRCELGVGARDRERLVQIARARAAARPSPLTLVALALLDDRDALTVAQAVSGQLAAQERIDGATLGRNEWRTNTRELVLDHGLALLAQRHPDDAALHRELASLALAAAIGADLKAPESRLYFRVIPGLDDERVAHAWARLSRLRQVAGAPVVLGPRSVRGFRSLPPDTVSLLEVEADEGTDWLGAIDALLAHGDSRAITSLERRRETWPASRWLAPFHGFTPRASSIPFGADAIDLDAIAAAPWGIDGSAPVWARLAAADGLRGAAASDPRARELAIELLEDASPAVHEAAREALAATDRVELARVWAERADPRRRARAAWLLGCVFQHSTAGGASPDLEALESMLELDPARIVRRAVAAARLERTHHTWLQHHERAVRWAAERGGRAELLAASPHALALRFAIGAAQARALLRYARDTDLAPHARAWIEQVATWSGGADGWTRACGKVERVRGTIATTTGEELRVELIRWSRAALPPELRLVAADEGFGAGIVPFGDGTSDDVCERRSVVRLFVRSAYSGLLDLRIDDGRAWTIRAWLTDDAVAAEDHAEQPIHRARRDSLA